MAKTWKVALIGIALVAASCSSDAADTATAEQTSTTTTAAVEEPVTAEVAGESVEAEDEDRPEAFGELCGNDELPVLEQMVVTANSGLRARALPVDGDIIDVLPTGTIVDTFGEANSCGVLEDGVWFEIGTPLLATGGWVHSDFLGPADDADTGTDAASDSETPAITDDDRPAVFGEPCSADVTPSAEQMVVVVNSRLRARAFPVDGDVIDSLPNGTVVDTSSDAASCGVLTDGVWYKIDTPLLATGGWVRSDFLDPVAG